MCSVHWEMFSTFEGYHEYNEGISWDIMSTSGDLQYIGGYHDACGGYHDSRGDIMSTLGDIMSTLGDVHCIEVFNIKQRLLSIYSPIWIMISPEVLMVSLWCTEHLWCTKHPPTYWTSIIQGDFSAARLLRINGVCTYFPLKMNLFETYNERWD